MLQETAALGEHLGSDEPADRVVHVVAEDRRCGQQREYLHDVEHARRRERTRCEQQRVAGQERGHDHARLQEDDQEQDPINPTAIGSREIEQMLIDVHEHLEGGDEEFHRLGSIGSGRKTSAGLYTKIGVTPAKSRPDDFDLEELRPVLAGDEQSFGDRIEGDAVQHSLRVARRAREERGEIDEPEHLAAVR